MITEEIVNKAIRNAIELIIDDSDYLVIRENQRAKRPNDPYTTVKILDFQPMSLEDRGYTDGDDDSVTENTAMSYNAFVGIKSFRDGSYGKGLQIRKGLARSSIIDYLNSLGLGLAQRTSVRNETFDLEDGYEERSGFNVYFNVVETDSDTITSIGAVDIDGEYVSPGGDTYPLDISINP